MDLVQQSATAQKYRFKHKESVENLIYKNFSTPIIDVR